MSAIKLSLSGKEFYFDDGVWKGEAAQNDVISLLEEKQELLEEIHYLKLKIEILFNMLAEEYAVKN